MIYEVLFAALVAVPAFVVIGGLLLAMRNCKPGGDR